MNFISNMDRHESKVELKYCERCGGLWLRREGTNRVHCRGCSAHFAGRPDPGDAPPETARSRRKRKKRGTNTTVVDPAIIGCLEGVAVLEVRA